MVERRERTDIMLQFYGKLGRQTFFKDTQNIIYLNDTDAIKKVSLTSENIIKIYIWQI